MSDLTARVTEITDNDGAHISVIHHIDGLVELDFQEVEDHRAFFTHAQAAQLAALIEGRQP